MYKEKIVDAITGEETFRDYTEAEVAKVEAAQALESEKMEEQAEKDVSKAALLAKLGITQEEAKLLLS